MTMLKPYVRPFWVVSISTAHGDANALVSCLFACSHGPLVDYDYVTRREVSADLEVYRLDSFPVGAEPMVGVWARCAAQIPTSRLPTMLAAGKRDFVSVSVHVCPDSDRPENSSLLEHLVAYRQGTRLLVEFSDETVSVERVGTARPAYSSPYEMGLHAASIVLWGAHWAGDRPPAPSVNSPCLRGTGDGHATG
jgi:hypothetical protein